MDFQILQKSCHFFLDGQIYSRYSRFSIESLRLKFASGPERLRRHYYIQEFTYIRHCGVKRSEYTNCRGRRTTKCFYSLKSHCITINVGSFTINCSLFLFCYVFPQYFITLPIWSLETWNFERSENPKS